MLIFHSTDGLSPYLVLCGVVSKLQGNSPLDRTQGFVNLILSSFIKYYYLLLLSICLVFFALDWTQGPPDDKCPPFRLEDAPLLTDK